MNGRIEAEKQRIDNDAVKKFFDQRVKKDLPYRYNYVNYQDDNPKLVIERDRIEKTRIVPQLPLKKGMRILDIGCGVGRWGDYFKDKDCTYIGVDYCENLLTIARKHFAGNSRFSFVCAPFQKLHTSLQKRGIACEFDLIMVNGVLVYINDEDIECCMMNLVKCQKKGGCTYIKESVSREKRLTLQKIHSKELGGEYSAIYRSVGEYDEMIKEYLSDYRVYSSGEVWTADVAQRKETTAYYWLMRI